MNTIFVKNGSFRIRRLALRELSFDPQLKVQLKTLPNADLNPILNPSTLPYSDSVISYSLTSFNGEVKKDRKIWISEKIIKKYPKPVSQSTPIGMPYETGFANTNVSSNTKKRHDQIKPTVN